MLNSEREQIMSVKVENVDVTVDDVVTDDVVEDTVSDDVVTDDVVDNDTQVEDKTDDSIEESVESLKNDVAKWKHMARKNEEALKALRIKEADVVTELDTLKGQVTENNSYKNEANVLRVALEKGLPLASVKFLQGETVEEITSSANDLLTMLGTSLNKQPSPNPLQALGDENKTLALTKEEALFEYLNQND